MADQVWFVTGSSRGLRRSVVEEALRAAKRVVATARRVDDLSDLAQTARDRLVRVPRDVTDPTQAEVAVQAAAGTFGRIDVVVNNAGCADLAIPPELIDAEEARVDRLPSRTPILPLHHLAGDPGRAVATIPDLERHKLYLGRLVSVEHGNGDRRKGAIEAIHMRFALVRYVDWDD
jgi:NAD(P)-dependent dehydrogenase (short-subunit alcohol dehydrogenase family)